MRANAIDTGFIERELKQPDGGGTCDRRRTRTSPAAVAIVLADEQSAASAEAHSPWQTLGWMPVGRRQRNFAFRQGQGGEHQVVLQYGNGPATLTIGEREIGFGYTVNAEGGNRSDA